jgi:hypothetical protein
VPAVSTDKMTSFGKNLMCQDFLLDSQRAFLNHGSFGAAPRSVFEYRQKYVVFAVILIQL